MFGRDAPGPMVRSRRRGFSPSILIAGGWRRWRSVFCKTTRELLKDEIVHRVSLAGDAGDSGSPCSPAASPRRSSRCRRSNRLRQVAYLTYHVSAPCPVRAPLPSVGQLVRTRVLGRVARLDTSTVRLGLATLRRFRVRRLRWPSDGRGARRSPSGGRTGRFGGRSPLRSSMSAGPPPDSPGEPEDGPSGPPARAVAGGAPRQRRLDLIEVNSATEEVRPCPVSVGA